MRQNPISNQELIDMYFAQGLSPMVIGERVGMTYRSVLRRLRSEGLTGRKAGRGRWMDNKLCAQQHPTVQDICWAAGVYEGEGSCADRSNGHRSPVVNLAQKDRWLCDRLCLLFGGSVARYQHSSNANEYYYWKLSGMRCRGFVMTIYKFLSPRRQQRIREALAE